MINFFSETSYEIDSQSEIIDWIESVISAEGYELGEINYVFCDDEYLHKLNVQFLKHDTLTDVISFDNSVGKEIHGEIYISEERVKENARDLEIDFKDEMHRVMVHGVLHFCGYQDKLEMDQLKMRRQEDEWLKILKNSLLR